MPTHLARTLIVTMVILVLATLLAACGGGSTNIRSNAGVAADVFASLPDDTRSVSTTSKINGWAFQEASPEAAQYLLAVILDATDLDYCYAMYGFTPAEGEQVDSLTLNLSDVSSECWLGLANYTENKWEWCQVLPATANSEITLSDAEDYTSSAGNFYWALVASNGHSVKAENFTVAMSGGSSTDPQFFVPPAGQETADSSGLTPQAVLLPDLDSTDEAGAPVIVYTKTVDSSAQLTLAYYDGDEWAQQALLSDRSCTLPQARWLDDEGVILTYDATNEELLDIRVDEWWEPTSETSLALPSGQGAPSLMRLDADPDTNLLAVACAFSGDPASVYWWQETATGWSQPMLVAEYSGETIPGLSYRFDPEGGDPWLVFTHGVADYETELSVDYTMEFGRFNGTSWELTTADRQYSPLVVDLGFDDSGTPQLVFSEVHDGTVTIKILIYSYDIDVPLLADVVVGTYSGSTWTYNRVFESDLDSSFNFGTMILTLTLNLAPSCGWARADELYYNNVAGSVDFLVAINGGSPTVTPQDGSLSNAVKYMVKGTGGSYAASSYFTGDPGMSLSWGEESDVHGCAYVFGEEVAVEDIMGGSLETENTLLYWSN